MPGAATPPRPGAGGQGRAPVVRYPLPFLRWQRLSLLPVTGTGQAACREHPRGPPGSLEPPLTRCPLAPLERLGGLVPTHPHMDKPPSGPGPLGARTTVCPDLRTHP